MMMKRRAARRARNNARRRERKEEARCERAGTEAPPTRPPGPKAAQAAPKRRLPEPLEKRPAIGKGPEPGRPVSEPVTVRSFPSGQGGWVNYPIPSTCRLACKGPQTMMNPMMGSQTSMSGSGSWCWSDGVRWYMTTPMAVLQSMNPGQPSFIRTGCAIRDGAIWDIFQQA